MKIKAVMEAALCLRNGLQKIAAEFPSSANAFDRDHHLVIEIIILCLS